LVWKCKAERSATGARRESLTDTRKTDSQNSWEKSGPLLTNVTLADCIKKRNYGERSGNHAVEAGIPLSHREGLRLKSLTVTLSLYNLAKEREAKNN